MSLLSQAEKQEGACGCFFDGPRTAHADAGLAARRAFCPQPSKKPRASLCSFRLNPVMKIKIGN